MTGLWRAARAAWLAISMLVSVSGPGCGGGSPSGIHSVGMLGVPSPALVGVNLLFVNAELNGRAGGRMLVDTGSPFTLVDPTPFTGLTLPGGPAVTVNIGFGELTVANVPALMVSVATMDKLDLGGIAGGNMLRKF